MRHLLAHYLVALGLFLVNLGRRLQGPGQGPPARGIAPIAKPKQVELQQSQYRRLYPQPGPGVFATIAILATIAIEALAWGFMGLEVGCNYG